MATPNWERHVIPLDWASKTLTCSNCGQTFDTREPSQMDLLKLDTCIGPPLTPYYLELHVLGEAKPRRILGGYRR